MKIFSVANDVYQINFESVNHMKTELTAYTCSLKADKFIFQWKRICLELLSALKVKISSRTESGEKDSVDTDKIAETDEKNITQAAFFLQKYGNQILRFSYSYVHNMEDAEDILQETMIRLVQKAPEFESEVHEKAWLFQVAGNLSKNRITYNAIRKTDELADELVAEKREDLSFVWEAVKKLPAHQREIIHLFYYEGYSTAEIGTILKQKETTVRSDLHRGREKLKEILKEAYDFDA